MRKKVILTSPLPIMLPIIKIVGNFCNLKCDYCFYHARNQEDKTIMSTDLLEKFIKEYLELFKGNLRFTWHGGEPLLAGLDFFEKIVEFQRRYSTKRHMILNTVQTNGTLIDNQWAHFFKNHDFRIGVSLDGVQKCHDRFRKNRAGHGSFERVLKGIKTLQKYKVPVSILSTLTRPGLKYAEDNFSFFTENLGIKTLGNCVYCSRCKIRGQNLNIRPEDLTVYLKKIIDLWLEKNDASIRVREIENHLAGLFGKEAALCLFNGWCTAFFCLESDGKIYPCDRMSGNEKLLFGNLSKNSLISILNSPIRLRYAQKANFLHNDCLSCNWKNSCNNGCIDYRDQNGKFYFCKSRQEIFRYLKSKLEDEGVSLNLGKEVKKNGQTQE